MAIYHFSVQRISRGQGKSSVGASAYRAGEKLNNERDGLTHDYTKRNDVVHSEIIAPDNSPEWVQDREKLWNQVESMEKRKDANTAREINVALPKELNIEQQKELVREFVKDNFTSKGMVADVAIHDKGEGNPHAHIMLTTRAITPEGFENKKVAYLDKKEKTVEVWRESWAKHTNQELEKAGIHERVDHRSFIDQGIEKLPTRHEGYKVRAMENRGVETEIGTHNKQVREENKKLELIDRQIKTYERSLENERIRANGTQDRNSGAERGIVGNTEFTRDIKSEIIFRRTSSEFKNDGSRTDRIDGQNKNLGGRNQQVESKTTGGQEKDSISIRSLDREGQHHNQGINARNERIEGDKQSEARSHTHQNNKSADNQREQLQGNHETTNGTSVSSQENSKPILERPSEAVRNTIGNNSRSNSSDIGNSSVGGTLDEILKTLSKSIEKADQEEKAKETLDKKIEQTKAKVRESVPIERKNKEKNKGWER